MKCFKHLTRAGKVLLLSAVVAFAASTAFAQTSVESKSSSDIFRGDADYFNTTYLWNNLEFDKVYIESELTPRKLDIGAAFNLGGLYISAYYNGSVIGGSYTNNKTADATVSELTDNDEYTTWVKVTNGERDTSTWGEICGNQITNDINVMLGIANMGIKLGYYGDGSVKSGKYDNADGHQGAETTTVSTNATDTLADYTDTVYGKGKKFNQKKYQPMVGFGIDLGAVKPYVDVRLPIYANGGSYSETKTSFTKGYTTKEVTKEGKKIDGYFGINPKIGAEIALGNGRIDLSYAPSFYIYNKDNGSEVTTTKTVDYSITNKGTKTTTVETINKAGNAKFRMDNAVNLDFVYAKEVADRVTLGGKVGLGLNFNFDNDTTVNNTSTKTTTSFDADYDNTGAGIAYEKVTETVTENPATKTNQTNINVIPELAGSVNFAAVPEKVSLIAGLSINVEVAYLKTTVTKDMNVTTTTTTDTDSLKGIEQTTKAVTVNNMPGQEKSDETLNTIPGASAVLGAVFTPTENFAISTCLNLKNFTTTGDNPFGTLVVQAQVKF